VLPRKNRQLKISYSKDLIMKRQLSLYSSVKRNKICIINSLSLSLSLSLSTYITIKSGPRYLGDRDGRITVRSQTKGGIISKTLPQRTSQGGGSFP
jgi:hypothetical protein